MVTCTGGVATGTLVQRPTFGIHAVNCHEINNIQTNPLKPIECFTETLIHEGTKNRF